MQTEIKQKQVKTKFENKIFTRENSFSEDDTKWPENTWTQYLFGILYDPKLFEDN